jgi:ubiquitin carboxyl-terminal hydrolase 25/28
MDGDKSKVARAVRVIGEHRQQYALEIFANQIESGDSSGATTLAEAYRRLQINDSNLGDEGVMNYYRTLCATAAAGSKASYTEALRTIAIARNSATLKAFADNPDGPIEVEKGSEDKPVGLDNIGNTCYLNSLLQYYYTVKPVRNIVMNFSDYRMDINTENMLKKRVGGRAVAKGEIVKAQRCKLFLTRYFKCSNANSRSCRRVARAFHESQICLYSIS